MALISDIDFMMYLNTVGIDYREKGDELKFHHCPFCEGDGKTNKAYGHFSFSRSKQTYYCFHRNSCGAQGGLYRFKMERGDLTPITKGHKVTYSRPKE